MLIGYSATAFTDPLMVLGMIAALWAALSDRPTWSGAALAFSFWAKQQGLLIAPLILWAIWVTPSTIPRLHRLGYFALTLGIGCTLLIAWDQVRPEHSLFVLASYNNNPERVWVSIDELGPRFGAWLAVIAAFFGLGGLLIVFARGRAVLPLMLYLIGYVIAHWLIAFNTYDRYLIPLIPLSAMVIGTGLARVPHFMLIAVIGVIVITTPPYFPDDQRARDDTILALADYLNAKPLGAIVYDHGLGWELGYYIGAWSDKRRVYYPEPQIQAIDALRNPDPAPRYLIASRAKNLGAWVDAFRRRGFIVGLVFQNQRYQVYRVIPPWADV
jgi:hypothetical protein